jgi:nucleotide-binding universal stress UspA family protein
MLEGVDEPVEETAPLNVRHVLLPLDGSALAVAAMPTARALAARFEVDVVAVSVVADEGERQRLRRHAVEALGIDASDDQVRVVVSPDPAQAITRLAAELGGVVCMSTRGRGRIAGTVMGSVARAVLLSSREPLIAVGPNADRPRSLVGRPRRRPASWPEPLSVARLVACVDGSAASEAVLPVAARWATALGMGLSILTVAEDAPMTLLGDRPNRFGPPHPDQYVGQLVDRWTGIVAGAVGEVVRHPISVSSGLETYLAGQPAGFVAVATHGRSGLDRIRLGATAADIVRASTAPALVVPVPDLTRRR